MTKCWKISGTQGYYHSPVVYLRIGENVSIGGQGDSPGESRVLIDGSRAYSLWDNPTITIEQVACAECGNPPGCDAPPPIEVKHDFINGVCIPTSTHNTQGKYSSLAACEANGLTDAFNQKGSDIICIKPSNYCPPGMKCLPLDEWGQIEYQSGQLKNNLCK